VIRIQAKRSIVATLLIGAVVISGFVVYESYVVQTPTRTQCLSLRGGTHVASQVTNKTFDAVTEYALPGNDTWPSAITADTDGSIWFVEQAVPGVAHLFPWNGTMVEYAWPGYQTPTLANCFPTASSSGIALWDGRVWSADEFGHAIFGVRPSDGSVVSLNVTGLANYPYWLAVGPDGNLWVTFDDTPAKLGRIFPNTTMSIIKLSGTGQDNPLQLDFVNSSLAFLSTINLSVNATTQGCICNGHIYSFDPSRVNSTITPSVVGGGYNLIEPTSVSYSQGRIWVAQHSTSSVASYDFESGSWTKYPTSRVPWTNTTLPLMVDAQGSEVWFNEHYANKIALLHLATGTLTEISESNPPAKSNGDIQNDEFIAASNGRLWFTSMTGNYVGFVQGNYDQGFFINATGTGRVTLSPGGGASMALAVTGTWRGQMRVNVSDSEGYFSIPNIIQVTPIVSAVPPGSSPYTLTVDLAVSKFAPAGDYTVAVTVTNGGIQQTAYLFVTVS